MTRGETNNNPGNIRISGANWLGKITPSADSAFEQFDTPEHGIRAIAKLLLTYYNQRINTITGIITRWAPPSDSNPTVVYISNVSATSGFSADATLVMTDINTLWPIVKGIIKQENGECIYPDSQIIDGCNMALGKVSLPPASKSSIIPVNATQKQGVPMLGAGWKTIAFSFATIALGVLQSADFTNIIAQHPGPIMAGVGVITFLLRLVTNTPPGIGVSFTAKPSAPPKPVASTVVPPVV